MFPFSSLIGTHQEGFYIIVSIFFTAFCSFGVCIVILQQMLFPCPFGVLSCADLQSTHYVQVTVPCHHDGPMDNILLMHTFLFLGETIKEMLPTQSEHCAV